MDFWYEFDLLFNGRFGRVPPDIDEAYRLESGLVLYWLADRDKSNMKHYPENLRTVFYTRFILGRQPAKYQTRYYSPCLKNIRRNLIETWVE
jgi:hypothetical protein